VEGTGSSAAAAGAKQEDVEGSLKLPCIDAPFIAGELCCRWHVKSKFSALVRRIIPVVSWFQKADGASVHRKAHSSYLWQSFEDLAGEGVGDYV
jgi:hypothetical protein